MAFSRSKTLMPLRLFDKDLMPILLPTLGEFGTSGGQAKPHSTIFTFQFAGSL